MNTFQVGTYQLALYKSTTADEQVLGIMTTSRDGRFRYTHLPFFPSCSNGYSPRQLARSATNRNVGSVPWPDIAAPNGVSLKSEQSVKGWLATRQQCSPLYLTGGAHVGSVG